MSSPENSHNNAYVNQTLNHNFSGEENVPRPPNPITESRVLGRILLNKNGQGSPQNQTIGQAGGGGGDTAGFGSRNLNSQIISPQTSQQPTTSPVISHRLNAEAKEFVPRFEATVVSNSYPKQEYNQDNEFNMSVRATEFDSYDLDDYNYTPYYQNVPYEDYEQDPGYFLENLNALTMNDQYDPLYVQEVESLSTNNPILDRFNQALHVLNMHPGNMEEYLRPICEMICNRSDTTEIVNDVVESLYNQSIQEANFRYTGARICQFLNTNLKNIPHFSGFNKIFIKRCQQEYNRREEMKNGSPEDRDRLRGLAMLMAEIFLNAETETPDGTVQRIQFLPGILVNFVNTLLSTISDLDVKCSCQLLKLSGGLIEDVVKHIPEECVKFEEIFAQLQSLESNPNLAENTKFIIGTVIKLKKSDWNRTPPSSSEKSISLPPSEPNNFQAQDPVFYNQMGTPCSRTEVRFPEEESEDGAYVLNEEEEEAFLTWQAEQDGLIEEQGALVIGDSGYDSFRQHAIVDEGGMGDEMEAAYEEFLQKQNYMQGYETHVAGPQGQQIPTSVPQTFNHPPPNMTQRQEFNGYQHQHILPSSQQQNQVPQHHQVQQQQYQRPPYHQDQQQPYTNDRYHYHN